MVDYSIYCISRVIFIPPCTPQLSPVLLTGTEKPCVKAVTITRAPVFIDRRATDLFMHFWIFINLQTAKESINKKTCGIAFHRLPNRHDMSGLQCISSLRPVRAPIRAVTLVLKCRHAIQADGENSWKKRNLFQTVIVTCAL